MSRTKTIIFAVAALLVAGCSEPEQAPSYDQSSRSYSGKSDTRPWESSQYKGDREQWTRDLARRAANLNEYSRTR